MHAAPVVHSFGLGFVRFAVVDGLVAQLLQYFVGLALRSGGGFVAALLEEFDRRVAVYVLGLAQILMSHAAHGVEFDVGVGCRYLAGQFLVLWRVVLAVRAPWSVKFDHPRGRNEDAAAAAGPPSSSSSDRLVQKIRKQRLVAVIPVVAAIARATGRREVFDHGRVGRRRRVVPLPLLVVQVDRTAHDRARRRQINDRGDEGDEEDEPHDDDDDGAIIIVEGRERESSDGVPFLGSTHSRRRRKRGWAGGGGA
mmetsp:Transcript_38970/g.83168  ORF Transcript_38970/g.83168 Transcript_38970/m.83168 type:complete len:253 (+) Transcript_38970:786-1544(+)